MDPVLLKFIDKLLVITAILAPIMFLIVVIINYRRYKVRAFPSMIFHAANFSLFAFAIGGRSMVEQLGAQTQSAQFIHEGFDLFELIFMIGLCFAVAFVAFACLLKRDDNDDVSDGSCSENLEDDYYHGVPVGSLHHVSGVRKSSKIRFACTLIFAGCVFWAFYNGTNYVFDGEMANSIQRSLISVATVNILYLILSAAGLILPMSFWGVRKKITNLKNRKKEEVWKKIEELRQDLREKEDVFYIEEAIPDHDRDEPRIFLSLEDRDGAHKYITVILNANSRGLLQRIQRHKIVKLYLTDSEYEKFKDGRPTSTFFDRISLH